MGATNRKNAELFVAWTYQRHANALRKYFARRVRRDQDVRELTQEVWMRLCRVRDPGRIEEPLAFVFGVAAHVLAQFNMEQGKSRSRVTYDAELADQAAESLSNAMPDDLAERADSQRALFRILSSLSESYRHIVMMRLCEGKSYQEIGSQLSLSARTTEEYYFRALAKIRSAERD